MKYEKEGNWGKRGRKEERKRSRGKGEREIGKERGREMWLKREKDNIGKRDIQIVRQIDRQTILVDK